MKYVKIMGLAAIAAAALMAFIGASTASASMGVLCKNNTSTEMCTEPYGVGQMIHAQLQAGATATLKSGTLTIDTCKKSTVTADITRAGSTTETGTAEITSLTWEECSCPTTTIRNGGLLVNHTPGTDNGELYGENVEVTLEGCLGFHCIYGTGAGPTTLGKVTGGTPAIFEANATINRQAGGRSGAFCPENGVWTTAGGAYEITEPNPLYVSTG